MKIKIKIICQQFWKLNFSKICQVWFQGTLKIYFVFRITFLIFSGKYLQMSRSWVVQKNYYFWRRHFWESSEPNEFQKLQYIYCKLSQSFPLTSDVRRKTWEIHIYVYWLKGSFILDPGRKNLKFWTPFLPLRQLSNFGLPQEHWSCNLSKSNSIRIEWRLDYTKHDLFFSMSVMW